MKRYKTLKGLTNQMLDRDGLNYQQIINGSFYHKNLGWTKFILEEDWSEQIATNL